jgi:hypothetical protein
MALAVVKGIEVKPRPVVIDHLVELWCGGTLVGALSAWNIGYVIKRVTIVEKNHNIRYVAKQCLLEFTSRFPTQIVYEAIRGADLLPQDVT